MPGQRLPLTCWQQQSYVPCAMFCRSFPAFPYGPPLHRLTKSCPGLANQRGAYIKRGTVNPGKLPDSRTEKQQDSRRLPDSNTEKLRLQLEVSSR